MNPVSSLTGAVTFLLGATLAVSLLVQPLAALTGTAATLFERVNEVRRAHHLIDLGASRELAVVAQRHADDMARRRYRSHVNPDGRNPAERVREAGLDRFWLLAENIGASSISGDRVSAIVDAWLNSTLHRENLLNPTFNQSGIGVARDDTGETIIVQLYAVGD